MEGGPVVRTPRLRAAPSALALAALALLLAPAPVDAARETRPEAGSGARYWMPLETGNRWTYAATKDRVVSLPDGKSRTETVQETAVDQVDHRLGAFAGAREAFELVGHRRPEGQPAGAGTEQKLVVSSSEDGRVVLHTGEVAGRPIEMLSPVTFMPADAGVGSRWHVGEMIMGGLRMNLDAEAVALEDVTTPAGSFRGCLVVRYTGTVGGQLPGAEGSVPIRSGSLQAQEWFAPGVGSVKYVSTTSFGLVRPDGATLRTDESVTRLLQSFRVGGSSAPAAPAP